MVDTEEGPCSTRLGQAGVAGSEWKTLFQPPFSLARERALMAGCTLRTVSMCASDVHVFTDGRSLKHKTRPSSAEPSFLPSFCACSLEAGSACLTPTMTRPRVQFSASPTAAWAATRLGGLALAVGLFRILRVCPFSIPELGTDIDRSMICTRSGHNARPTGQLPRPPHAVFRSKKFRKVHI